MNIYIIHGVSTIMLIAFPNLHLRIHWCHITENLAVWSDLFPCHHSSLRKTGAST